MESDPAPLTANSPAVTVVDCRQLGRDKQAWSALCSDGNWLTFPGWIELRRFVSASDVKFTTSVQLMGPLRLLNPPFCKGAIFCNPRTQARARTVWLSYKVASMGDEASNPLSLNEKEFLAMLHLSERYLSEAKRCRACRAYLAGIVMVGAAFETILMCMVSCDSKKIASWVGAPKWRGDLKPLSRWSMTELMDAAEFGGWLPRALRESSWDTNRALPGDYAEVLRIFRNLVHPNRYLQDFARHRFSRKLLDRLLNIYEEPSFLSLTK